MLHYITVSHTLPVYTSDPGIRQKEKVTEKVDIVS